jgi:hypothetical protein
MLFGREDQIRVVVTDGLRGAGREQVIGDGASDFVDVPRPECGELYSVNAFAKLSRNA